MRALVQVLVVIVGLGVSSACARWTKTDVALEAAFVVVAGIDWQQTDGITDACRETNFVIGECGDRVPHAVYFPVVLAAHLVVAALLPPRWRTIFQGITFGVEAATVYYNWRADDPG